MSSLQDTKIYNLLFISGLNYRSKNAGKCFLCEYPNNDKVYLVTTLHSLKNKNDYSVILDHKYTTQNFIDNTPTEYILDITNMENFKIPLIDVAIFVLNKLDLHNYDLNYVNMLTNLYTIDHIENLSMLNHKLQNVLITNLEPINNHKYAHNYPEMSSYTGNYSNLSEGLSGSSIFDDNLNVFGILHAQRDNILYLIPFIFIKRILDEINENYIKNYPIKFNGLCDFLPEINKHQVTKIYQSISPNIYSECTNQFQLNDYILKVDDLSVNRYGEVFYEELGCNVSIRQYVILKKTINDRTKFEIRRSSKKIFTKTKMLIQGNRDMKSCFNINFDEDLIEKKIDNQTYYKINLALLSKLINDLSINQDNCKRFGKLLECFKLKYSNIFDNKWLLIEDLKVKYSLFENDNYKNLYISVF